MHLRVIPKGGKNRGDVIKTVLKTDALSHHLLDNLAFHWGHRRDQDNRFLIGLLKFLDAANHRLVVL